MVDLAVAVVVGTALTAIVTAFTKLIIIAAVVYFLIVLPVNTIKARRKSGAEAGPAEPTDVELLAEIRDLLAGQQKKD